MTFQEAISDPRRPLSVTPKEWMEYELAREEEDKELFDNEAKRIIEEETGEPVDGDIPPVDRLGIGLRQMTMGCRMAIRALQDISRTDLPKSERNCYLQVEDAVFNGVAPYLSDALESYSGGSLKTT